MARQITLFDSWKTGNQEKPTTSAYFDGKPTTSFYFDGKSTTSSYFGFQSTNNSKRPVETIKESPGRSTDDVIPLVDDENDDDWNLAAAIEASKIEYELEKRRSNRANFISRNFFVSADQPSTSRRDDEVKCAGFDEEAGKIWIYPTNFPKRNYQFEIIEKALFYNTLVTLPTGLGKTFIAAVVMYNFYRWYPSGKVIFMAPTKPLVAQQVEACYNIMGIPQNDVAEMTGSILPARRTKLWQDKRVFFLTPQVINNDLQKHVFPADSVKCVVIDEAHKATGDHAYCQVVRELMKCTKDFRVLALSATPGSDLNAVQQVLSNLLIAHLELRSEESPEIRKYTHARNIECVVVSLSDELKTLREKYEQVVQYWLNVLSNRRVLYATTSQTCSLTNLLSARAQFREHRPAYIQQWQSGIIEGAFANAIGLLHGYFLLSNMGMKSLYNYFQGKMCTDRSTAVRRELTKNPELKDIYQWLRERFASEEIDRDRRLQFPADDESYFDRSHAAVAFSTQQVTDIAATSHPKLVKLVEILIDHFKTRGSKNTRVMVFAQYRDCVEEITDLLRKQRPLIRPMKFVGQTSARSTAKGISQKEQLRVVKQFKDGGYNTLISTSVGEEGLDIGEVDLIVCYDATASPVRSVQRMGRTGRKREGKIIVLVTEGKEQNIFTNSEYSKKRVHKAIVANKKFELYRNNRRMVPSHLAPTCLHMHTTCEKPYENQLLRKRPADNPSVESVKKYTGNLSAFELHEWERDFKVNEFEPIKALSDRRPLKLLGHTGAGRTTAIKSCLNEYALWQDRSQTAFFINASTLRETFVNLAKLGQGPATTEDVDYTATLIPGNIKQFCKPRQYSPAVRNPVSINRNRVLKPKRQLKRDCGKTKKLDRGKAKKLDHGKSKMDLGKSTDQVQLEKSKQQLYQTPSGHQLDLDQIFPAPKLRGELRCYEYLNPDAKFPIPSLKSTDVIEAIRSMIRESGTDQEVDIWIHNP